MTLRCEMVTWCGGFVVGLVVGEWLVWLGYLTGYNGWLKRGRKRPMDKRA